MTINKKENTQIIHIFPRSNQIECLICKIKKPCYLHKNYSIPARSSLAVEQWKEPPPQATTQIPQSKH